MMFYNKYLQLQYHEFDIASEILVIVIKTRNDTPFDIDNNMMHI